MDLVIALIKKSVVGWSDVGIQGEFEVNFVSGASTAYFSYSL